MPIDFSICSLSFADNVDNNGKISWVEWVEATNAKFEGKIGFSQETIGTMEGLIAKYKTGDNSVKIYAIGKIVDMDGKVLAVFNETPAKIVKAGNSEYYQFDENDWRYRSSLNRFEQDNKVFHK